MASLKKAVIKDKTNGEKVPRPAVLGVSVGADIERLKTQVDAINDLRRTYSERLENVYSQISELKDALAKKDEFIRDIEAKAKEAGKLADSVQPNKLFLELKKDNVKIAAIESKIDSYGLMAKKMSDELKEIRNIGSSIEVHSDKVERIFDEAKKRFDELEGNRKYTEERLMDFERSIALLKGNIESMQNTKERKSLKNDTSKAIMLIEEAKSRMKSKDTDELMRLYGSLNEEYQSLSSNKKDEIYDDVKKIYDWLDAAR